MNAGITKHPHFLVIGAQKAGTSWLHARLREHSSVFVPEDKDFEFFAYPDGIDKQAFWQRFSNAAENQLTGDVCASYFWTADFGRDNPHFNRDIPGTVLQALGDAVDIFVLLRDPVTRAISAYLHHITFGAISARTGILDAPDNLGILAMSRYGTHLENWLAHFPAQRIHLLPSPDEIPGRRILELFCQKSGIRPGKASSLDNKAVFPGVPRNIDNEGIWVNAASLVTPPEDRSRRRLDNTEMVQLIDRHTLRLVADELRTDTARLSHLLRDMGAIHPAFRRWQNWPTDV